MGKDGDGLCPEPLSPQGAASLSQFLQGHSANEPLLPLKPRER